MKNHMHQPYTWFLSVLLCLPAALSIEAKTYEIYPEGFTDAYDPAIEPLLRINSGDRVRTRTPDGLGTDYNGVPHAKDPFGYPGLPNALIGPFYIEGADYGDALEVHLDKVRLNRNWGWGRYRLMTAILNPNTIEGLYKNYYQPDAVWPGQNNLIRWDLDLARGVANPRLLETSGMKFDLPVRPMIGCIGVAAPGTQRMSADVSSTNGGNMDYNDTVEGVTLFFPVYHKGAYFYLGDGHALQGDGEGLGAAIETSLDVEFTVKVHKGKRLELPRLINDEYIVSIGSQPEFASSLDLAIQQANSDMINWLTQDYKLTAPEAHLLMGMVVQHKIVTYLGSVTTMIPRKYLPR